MQTNTILGQARKSRKDEFFTQKFDVQNELDHYTEQLKGAHILCCCNDYHPESGFSEYFIQNFNEIGLKSLTLTSFSETERAYKAVITHVDDNDSTSLDSILKYKGNSLVQLEGNGDFRSPEMLQMLDDADDVITNPPFSLFREFVSSITQHNVQYLIIGNMNCITYKDILPLFMHNQMWLGYRFNHRINGRNMIFKVPDDYPLSGTETWELESGKYIGVPGTGWFTNIDTKKRHTPLALTKHFDSAMYPKYDHYDAIEVGKTCNIPVDYVGVMGVPITFIDKYCPEQFEILGDSRFHDGNDVSDDISYVNGKLLYRRILIRYTEAWKTSHTADFAL